MVEVPRDAALDAPATTSNVVDLAGLPMVGPYATRAKLCDAQACPAQATEIGGQVLPVKRDCPTDVPDEDTGVAMPKPPAGLSEVFLKSINCRMVGIRDASRTYRVAVHRADGYWISRPLFTVDGNDKYCSGGLVAKWEARDVDGNGAADAVATIKAHTDCLACNKDSDETSERDLVIAVSDAKAAPTYFETLVVGEHFHQKGSGVDCPAIDYDASMTVVWSANGVTLRGPAAWKPQRGDAETGLWMSFYGNDVPSTAGAYRFVVP